MDNQTAYNQWSAIYDTNNNKTRDLEAIAIRTYFADASFQNILELGCGTGKNTFFLLEKCQNLTGADFSVEMLAVAKTKIVDPKVQFVQMDLREKWDFTEGGYDAITCSLVLEHIADLNHIFSEAHRILSSKGLFYIGEYHPFKQYLGKKARFETANGVFELETFTHHLTDFYNAAHQNGFECLDIQEWFDEGERKSVPRILSLVFQKF
jgi:ubiquinone/menaquinone biosynthesis C-methylase UbiE